MLTTTTPQQISEKVAAFLLEIKAIKLNANDPFTWASGWKSPIYCDNRISLSYPEVRTYIKEALCKVIKEKYPNAEAIAGVATAGIPQGALVAEAMGLPFVYVRSKPKGHGMENMIEGKVTPGQKVVVIEDLISTGGSSLKASQDLIDAKFEVLGMAAIFTYGFPLADENFQKAKIELVTLSDYEAMLPIAVSEGYLTEDQVLSLQEWRQDPGSWHTS
jgi:orotate phosphoribosyltransferase